MALTASPRRAAWVMVAGLILGLFLVTGTRSSLLLLIGPLAMAALAGWNRIRSSVWTIVSHGAVAATLVVAFQIALALPVVLRPATTTGEPGSTGSAAPSVPSVLGDRLGSIPGALQNPASDQSLKERVAQYRAAWELFVSRPILGVGPGHSIDWVDSSGQPRTGFTADTPLVLPAKFGLVGILVLSGAAVAYGLTVRTALRRDRQSVVTLTLVGYGAWTVVSLPLGFPVEDKGASLALMLLLALAFIEGGRVQQR
jgi:O-antigen ligase